MSAEIYKALARTAQLFRMDVFGSDPDDDSEIIEGLRATSARIVADRKNLSCAAGQTAVFTLYAQLAMLGVQVDLDLPNVAPIVPQPPYRDFNLPDSLVEYSDDLLPGGSSRPADRVQITFVIGDSSCSAPCVRICGTDTAAVVGADLHSTRIRWTSTEPFTPIAAACAGAADAARVAVPVIARRLNVAQPQLPAWTFSPDRSIEVDLSTSMPTEAARGHVDVVSGGAITNAMIYSLLRAVDSERLDLRVLEPEPLDLSNLNRYTMARRSWVGRLKTSMLASYSSERLSIRGVPLPVDDRTASTLRPWAAKVAVGVDDIPSRWLTQAAAAESWIGVGATSHDYVLVSEHLPGQACAGCAHTRSGDTDGPIPTICFVSLWAGLMLALKVLRSDSATTSGGIHVWPLGLENPRGVQPFVQAPVSSCPVGCSASLALRVGQPS